MKPRAASGPHSLRNQVNLRCMEMREISLEKRRGCGREVGVTHVYKINCREKGDVEGCEVMNVAESPCSVAG
jgi:hypothetical protein